MAPQSRTTRTALLLGAVFYIIGLLMMCYCPGPYVIAAISFGVAAATANGRLRWYAVAFLAVSVITGIAHAIREAEITERARANALGATRQFEAREKAQQDQP